MSIPYLHELSIDAANDAYYKTEQRRNNLLQSAAIKRHLADQLDSALLNCRIEERARTIYPDYIIHYGNSGDTRRLYISTDPNRRAATQLIIPLGRRGDRRISGEALRRSADTDQKEAARLADLLSTFYDHLAQYNALARYAEIISADLRTIFCHTSMYY